MPRRVAKSGKRSSAKSRRLSKALKQYWARVRNIQKRAPDLTLPEARQRDRETIQETIGRGIEHAVKSWQKVAETKRGKALWRETDQKKRREIEKLLREEKIRPKKARELLDKAVKGPRRSTEHVKRSRAQLSRWELIYRTARRFKLTVKEAEQFLKKMRETMQSTEYKWAKIQNRKGRKMRTRDAAYVAEWTDRYENVRLEFGI